jgi:hypothetical protein
VQASEIPELRRFCHSIAADAQLLEAKNMLQPRLSALLSSIDLWATSSIAACQDEILEFDKSIDLIFENWTNAKKKVLRCTLLNNQWLSKDTDERGDRRIERLFGAFL